MAKVINYKPPTMNELPVPQGSWQDANSARQKRYNLQLLAGIASIVATVGYVSCFHHHEWCQFSVHFCKYGVQSPVKLKSQEL